MRFARLIFEAAKSLGARGSRGASERAADQLAKLVGVEHFASLDEELSRLATTLFNRVEEMCADRKRVAVPDWLVPFKIGPAVKPLNAAKLWSNNRRVDRVEETARRER